MRIALIDPAIARSQPHRLKAPRYRARAARRAQLLAALTLLMLLAGLGCATARTPGIGWHGLQAGNWPAATWRPYASSSPFNQPIGHAAVHPYSAQLVAGALQWGPPAGLTAGIADSSEDYGHPVYYSTFADPVYVLHATEHWGRNSIDGLSLHVPAQARPAGGGDHHMTIVTPGGWEYDLWRAQAPPAGGGMLTFAWGGRTRIDGSGLGGLATAAHFAALAGVIRPEELAVGHIDHALFIVLKCAGTGAAFGYSVHANRRPWSSSYVYPAQGAGKTCRQDDPTLPPLGTRFQLAMSGPQIAALHAPLWKRSILRALARYGGYVGDTGGPGFAFALQSSSTYTSFGAPDRFVELARQLRIAPRHGRYTFELGPGVDWWHYLRVVVPPRN